MANSHAERSRFGSPPVWQDDLARNWECTSNDATRLLLPEKLSPTQKRRRRLQRQAVRKALVYSNGLKQKLHDIVPQASPSIAVYRDGDARAVPTASETQALERI